MARVQSKAEQILLENLRKDGLISADAKPTRGFRSFKLRKKRRRSIAGRALATLEERSNSSAD